MTVLAIDAGETTGFAHSAGPHGTWALGGHAHPGSKPWWLYKHIIELGNEHPFDLLIFEGGYPTNRKGSHVLEHLRGAVVMAAFCAKAKTRIIAPATLKLYWAGHGFADKSQMIRATIDRTGIVPVDHNESDAIALLHMARCNKPAERISLPPRPKKKKAVKVLASADVDKELFPF